MLGFEVLKRGRKPHKKTDAVEQHNGTRRKREMKKKEIERGRSNRKANLKASEKWQVTPWLESKTNLRRRVGKQTAKVELVQEPVRNQKVVLHHCSL